MYGELKEQYARQTLASQISFLASLLLMKLRTGCVMASYIAKLEGLFAQLAPMKLAKEEPLKVAISLVNLSKLKGYTTVVISLKMLGD